MNRLIIVGSPRTQGRSATLANLLFESCIEECPEDELALVPVSEVEVSGCNGCGACSVGFNEPEGDEEAETGGTKSKQAAQFDHPRRCAIDDDMADIYPLIDEAEELTIVSPVYFAGPPAQLKALLDRLQPYYAATASERAAAAEAGETYRTAVRPAVLHVVGEGSDPHGFAALVTIVQSAVAVAGFKLEAVLDWVGKISPEGEILADAECIDLLSEDEDVIADFEVMFDEADDQVDWGGELDFEDFEGAEEPAVLQRPQLHFDDVQVQERGRASSESGRSGGSRGRTEKRSGKGGTQTNNRNPRKENQSKAKKRHASNAQSSKKGGNQGGSRQANGGKGRPQGKSGARKGGTRG